MSYFYLILPHGYNNICIAKSTVYTIFFVVFKITYVRTVGFFNRFRGCRSYKVATLYTVLL